MFELNGKHNNCTVFTDNVDNETISQLIQLLNQPFVEGSKIRIMPDCHAGAGCVIGTTMTLTDKVCPNLVGVDIGCSVSAYRLGKIEVDFPRLDEIIKTHVPSGFTVHDTAIAASNADKILAPVNVDLAFKSLGTLGGGNHFIEVSKDADGYIWLVIHTGSRHLGLEVAHHYQDVGYKKLKKADNAELIQKIIAQLKSEGRQCEIEDALKVIHQTKEPKIPKDLCYVTGKDFEDYIHDMKLTQEHARINHQTIAEVITKRMHWNPDKAIFTMHNYIDTDQMILRKGSVSADKDVPLIIPMNMRDGSLLCTGKGNPEWNYSAPHGAGRILSRSKAKDVVDMNAFKDSMKGIYSTSVCESTKDESPFAYKPADEIINCIGDTVEINEILKPIYNYKAH